MDDQNITLTWAHALRGQAYRAQLARERSFAHPSLDRESGEGRLRLLRPPGGTYYLRTQATDVDGFVTPFGAPTRIELTLPPLIVLAPILEGTTLSLNWSRGDAQFKRLIIDREQAESRLQLYRPYPGEYFVRLAWVEADGFVHSFAPAQRFSIAPGDAPAGLRTLTLRPAE